MQPLREPGAFAALLRRVRLPSWVVFAKGSVVGPDCVLDYLGRHAHRVAIGNRRLRALDTQARTVSFTYKDYAERHSFWRAYLSPSCSDRNAM